MEPIKKDKKCKRKLEKNFKEEEELSDEDANEDMMEEEIDYSSKKKPMEGDEDWDDDEEITVDFEFYDPNPNQFFSIKSLINGYLDGLSYKSSDLAQIIIDQVQVGTMIGTLDEEEAEALNKNKQFDKNILGFASILSFSQNKKQKVFQEIIKYIEDKSKIHNANHDNFLKILNNHNIGLFINERIINLSPKLIPILHSQLLKDLEWAQDKNLNENANDNFKFEYVLCVTKIYKEIVKQNSKKKKNESDFKDYIFPKFEDFAILKKNPNYFMFPALTSKNNAGITNLEGENNKEQCYRLIWLISLKDLAETFKGLDEYLE